MPRPYSLDLRERAVGALQAGMPRVEVCRIFGISSSTLWRWNTTTLAGESLLPKPPPGRPRLIPVADEAALRQQVADAPDATLDWHRATWAASHGVVVSNPTMSRELTRLGLSLKRRH